MSSTNAHLRSSLSLILTQISMSVVLDPGDEAPSFALETFSATTIPSLAVFRSGASCSCRYTKD
jgi:hypothetical protein